MKYKNLWVVALLSISFLSLVWCGNSQKITTCTVNLVPEDWTKREGIYRMIHDGKYVNSVETIETIESNDKEILDKIKSILENSYRPFKNLEYFDYNIEETDNMLITKVTINYAKININKYIQLFPQASNFVSDGKIPLDSLKALYGMMDGATCE